MEIFHITSLRNAYSILSSGRYRPCYPSPLAQDSGLNAGIVGQFLSPQAFESTGVKIIFEWAGAVTQKNTFPLPHNTMLISLPWRVVVSHGTTKGLSAIGIEVDDENQYLELVRQPPSWLPQAIKDYWIRREIKVIKSNLNSLLSKKPNIIVLP